MGRTGNAPKSSKCGAFGGIGALGHGTSARVMFHETFLSPGVSKCFTDDERSLQQDERATFFRNSLQNVAWKLGTPVCDSDRANRALVTMGHSTR
jgi:hypothetical protein